MPDSLYLSLWFRSFEADDMLPHALAVMRQFPFAERHPGITYLTQHPVSWDEATILEQRFLPEAAPEEAVAVAFGLLHEDNAYIFEASWDLWKPVESGEQWISSPSPVKFIVRGDEFEEGESQQEGHIQVDFGLETPFLYEEVKLTSEIESRVRSNVQKLVEFTTAVEKNSGDSARLLWSESEENLAQKLINRLQRVQ